jgi:hypothetical protein
VFELIIVAFVIARFPAAHLVDMSKFKEFSLLSIHFVSMAIFNSVMIKLLPFN